jgi:phosphate transport system permease protein
MQINNARAARRRITSQIFTVACLVATGVALLALCLILWSLFTQGFGGMSLEIFTMDTPAPGSKGGLRNAIIGSLLMCAIAMVIAVVIGVLAGTWLAEIGGDTPYGQVVRFLNDVLLSAPSILIGLFVYGLLVVPFQGFSGWAGAVALAIIAVPIVTRTTEDILNLQPNALREAGMALGASQFTTIRRIIWKAAGAGLLTGGLLGFARISGETAPLLFTALNNQFLPDEWLGMLNGPTGSVPVTMYNMALSPDATWNQLAWAGALLVAMAVLGVNIIGRWLARDKLSK